MTYKEICKKYKLNNEICLTCTHYNNDMGYCFDLDCTTHNDFICDGYKRKRSGQYRRMRAKQNRGKL